MMNKKGFTLVEMLTTTVILVIVFALLAVIFGRATTIHKVVRSGGDAENFGIYLLNTITYGPGVTREEGLVTAPPFQSTALDTELVFLTPTNQSIFYRLTGGTLLHNNYDLKPTWAKDRQLEVLSADSTQSKFFFYDKDLVELTSTDTPYYVGIRLVLKNTLQNIQEAVTLYRCVRVRNWIEF